MHIGFLIKGLTQIIWKDRKDINCNEFKNNFLEINGYENVAKIQDKKISLLKEKNYLEKKIDFIENKIDERIKKSLNL